MLVEKKTVRFNLCGLNGVAIPSEVEWELHHDAIGWAILRPFKRDENGKVIQNAVRNVSGSEKYIRRIWNKMG